MFEPLLTRLAANSHGAPDYRASAQRRAHQGVLLHLLKYRQGDDHFTEALKLNKYTLYMQTTRTGRLPDGAGSSGSHRSPDRARRGGAQRGFGRELEDKGAFWADRAANEARCERTCSRWRPPDAARRQRSNPEKYDPDLWADDTPSLTKPARPTIQSDLFYDYRTNVILPKWQAWMQKTQPPVLVLWGGKYDLSFEPTEPEAYRREVPKPTFHVLDAGHFALISAADDCGLFAVSCRTGVDEWSRLLMICRDRRQCLSLETKWSIQECHRNLKLCGRTF